MRVPYFLLLILIVCINAAEGKTETFNFTVENNTVLNFNAGYYVLEVVEINPEFPRFVKVNLTTDNKSKTFYVYEGENPYLTKPYDRIDLRADYIAKAETSIQVTFPGEWGFPKKYIMPGKLEVPRIPLITLTKSADRTRIGTGDVVEIKIIVLNEGNGTAYNLTLKEELPQGFSRAPGSRFPPEIQNIIEPGDRQELYYALKAVEQGIFTIEPTKVTYGLRSSGSNTLTIEVVEERSNLTAAISMDKYDAKTDDVIRAVIKISNAGKRPATSILIDGNLPSGLAAVDGDLRHVFKKIDPDESEEYTVALKALEPGNYRISLKTFYNDDRGGSLSTSGSITVTRSDKSYLSIIIFSAIIIFLIAFALKRHREYSF